MGKVQFKQIGEGAKTWNRAAQLVLGEVQMGQTGEGTQARNRPNQVIFAEIELCDATFVCDYAVPTVERLVAEPVVVVRPVGAVGGVVEGDEGRPVTC